MLHAAADIDLSTSKIDVLAAHMVGTWQWDIVNDRVTCDRTNAVLLGLTQDEARRGVRLQRVVDAVHPDDRERFKSSAAPVRETGGTVDVVVRTMPAPDIVRRVIVRGRYEPNERGTMVRGYGLLIDLTDKPAVSALPMALSRAIPDDPIAQSAELCRSARRIMGESGSFRLRILLDMIALEYNQLAARDAKS